MLKMTPFKRRDSYFINKEQLGEEIANLQELVQDMKDGFTGAMQELARIQSGDQMMRATIEKNRTDCEKGIAGVKEEITQLKNEVHLAVNDFKVCQRTVEELKMEVVKLREINETKQDQLKLHPSVISSHDETSLPPKSSNDTNGESYDTLTARRPTLPRVSPMLQTFIESLSNPVDCTIQHSREFPTDDGCHQIEVSRSSSSLTNNSRTTLSTIPDVKETSCPFRTDSEDRRLQLARELLDNEAQYQTDLRFLIENVRERLLQSNFISSDDVKIIFPTTLGSIREKHCGVLEAIDRRIRNWDQHNTLGDIYARITGSNEKLMEKYRQYIRGFSACVSTFSHYLKTSSEFSSFIREAICSHYPDYSNPNRIMFAPLHRIPYYVQHIKRLQECTGKDHPDQYHLVSSLKQLKQFVKKINNIVKRTKSEDNTSRSHALSVQPNEFNVGSNNISNDTNVTLIVTSPVTEQKTVNSDKKGINLRQEANDSQTEKDRSTESSKQESKSCGLKDEYVAGGRTGRRRSLSAYMLEIPEEPNVISRLGRSLSPSRLEQLRLEESRDTDAESSDNDSQDGDAESGTAMSSKDGDASQDATSCYGDDLSQEELKLIGKPLVNKHMYLALESGNSPQRAPSFGVYGDLDWKGEGGEYVPSAIEMSFPSKQNQSQNRWKNNPAYQLIRQQSEKTESEYHTSDDEPIPINSPMYDVAVSGQPKRGLEKRRRSSLGELMVIPPQQEDKSFCIQWETMDTTSDETTENDGFLSGGQKSENIFQAVSHQRKKFGMRRRSIDASDPSIRGSMGGSSGSVVTPRKSWIEEDTGQQQPNQSQQTLGDKLKHPLKNVLKRVTANSDNKLLRSDDVNAYPPDVMQQLAEIARMIVESSESPTKNKDPCSDV